MLIKFKKPDPRAGMTARMDSSRGQQLVDAGSADAVPESAVVSRGVDVRAALDIALRELPGGQDDPDYVVRAMRNHFGEVFADADEAKVRELVVKPQESVVGPQSAAKVAESDKPTAAAEVQGQEPAAAPKPARGKK